jgi:transposase
MRHVREVLRLTTAGVGLNEIARRVGVAPSTIRLTLKRLARAGLSWPLPGEMTDTALETALFAAAGTEGSNPSPSSGESETNRECGQSSQRAPPVPRVRKEGSPLCR